MCEIENIFDDGLEISVKQEGIVNFTVRERQTKKDIIIPFEEKKGRFYITFYDLSRVLYSDNTKAFFDFYLWIDGKRFSKIKNFRKRPREISKVIETVNKITQVNHKITITPFKSSINTLGCELLNQSVKEKEFISKGGIRINYVEKLMKDNFRNKLIVTFPYNSPMNTRIKKSEAFYQYQKTLSNVGANKISIKDNGGKVGNWFLGFGDFEYRDATIEFLRNKFEELQINKKDVIFFGVSKGGYNAILFGLLLGIGNIVVSSPISKVYTFLGERPQNEYIFPKDITERQKLVYDDLIGEAALNLKGNKPHVYAVTSCNDEYYEPHVPYLENVFKENEIPYQMYHNPNPDITRHGLVYNRSRNEIFSILYQLICGSDGFKIIE